ncbi:hypothetical protein D3C83_276410 [compost metagenome]
MASADGGFCPVEKVRRVEDARNHGLFTGFLKRGEETPVGVEPLVLPWHEGDDRPVRLG